MTTIIPISLPLPYNMGKVNCYLLTGKAGFVLVDAGSSNARARLENTLAEAGCQSGNLKLVILTHGDFDHSGNAAYIGRKFMSPVGMGAADRGMVEKGDMFVNRKQPGWLVRKMIPLATGFGRRERFSPDILLEDGSDLSRYGVRGKIISLPGHSLGSIGILLDSRELICGDLFENQDGPRLNSIMDDKSAATSSLERLRKLRIKTVFPGHGEPFQALDLIPPPH